MYGKSAQRGASWFRVALFFALDLAAVNVLLVQLEPPLLAPLRLPLLVVTIAVLVLSTTVYVLAPAFSVAEQARARAAYGTHRDVLANLCAVFVWGVVLFLPLILLGVSALEHWQEGPVAVLQEAFASVREMQPIIIPLALIGQYLAMALVIYLRLLRPGATTRQEMGLTGSRFWRNLGLGLLGGLLILLANGALGAALSQVGLRSTQAEQFRIPQATPAVFYLLLAAGTLLAPFVEEAFFRGYVFRAYLTSRGPLRAYAVSSLLFVILHGNPASGVGANVALFLPLLVVALILAYLFHRSGSLVSPITAHGVNNGVALIAIYYLARVST